MLDHVEDAFCKHDLVFVSHFLYASHDQSFPKVGLFCDDGLDLIIGNLLDVCLSVRLSILLSVCLSVLLLENVVEHRLELSQLIFCHLDFIFFDLRAGIGLQ